MGYLLTANVRVPRLRLRRSVEGAYSELVAYNNTARYMHAILGNAVWTAE